MRGGLNRPEDYAHHNAPTPKALKMKRLHVCYSGLVQGVGFRYTAQDIAQGLGLTGWVKNLEDGRVEVMAEGTEGALKKLISKIGASLGRYIRSSDIEWGEAAGEFEEFEIRF